MCKVLTPDDESLNLRRALGQYPTGVAVVTASAADGSPVGMTINSFCSISLVPALIGWCIDRKSRSYGIFSTAERFTITVLSETQSEIARRFATRGSDKFRGLSCETTMPPVIPKGSAWLKCLTFQRFRLGDHLMLVGKVVESDMSNRKPLVFAQGSFTHLQNTDFQPQAIRA